MSAYRCEATSVAGFIQQLAVSYLRHGYWFYVTGEIPAWKDPRAIDRKLIERYEIDRSKWARGRDRRRGVACLQYLRHKRFFVLLATHGEHRFFEEEAASIHDARRRPIRFAGYSISHRGGHPHVRLDSRTYLKTRDRLLAASALLTRDELVRWIHALGFVPFAPVRRQLLNLARAVNRRRRGSDGTIGYEDLPLRRRPVRPFDSCGST